MIYIIKKRMMNTPKPYRFYSVGAGTLNNMKLSFDSLEDCDEFLNEQIKLCIIKST